MKSKIFIAIIGIIAPAISYSQVTDPSLKEIELVVLELFNAYRDGDSARVHAVFSNEAQMQTVYTSKEGEPKISELKPTTGFVDYVGGGFEEVHDEQLWDMEIHADHQLATVWTRYAFYLGEKFIHCGTETFLLRKENGQWLIFYLADTRQKEDCKIPAKIKK
jgi:hypothetical protein